MSKASVETDMRDYGLSYPVSKQTNADRIRNMSDEELAKILVEFDPCLLCSNANVSMCNENDCGDIALTLEWLQAEVKEEC